MRIKDDSKRQALIRATVRLVNEIGFSAASVSKIAGEANVSPATLYTYFENKDDLIVDAYRTVMGEWSQGIFQGLDSDRSVRDVLHSIWCNTFRYVSRNRDDYLYTEQFSKSPYMQRISLAEMESFFGPLLAVIHRGVDEKILKDVHSHMHMMFFFYPILSLANPGSGHSAVITEKTIETAFLLAWDAIRL
ncbi:TetR/AcrR family transcriptional regulator [uncultured Pseudodesulfovibrio sp.]|uniref:TetR/AcrR family transcriptional regulator n=1 Tax=uncultured Pseudodesulfovibrio sp. TaxID=2035858 RepID=UPI0029C7BC65|nr:TetR/AcrR family transcriptional regulator [uncultured Pseudodesulfovibrio sp.]